MVTSVIYTLGAQGPKCIGFHSSCKLNQAVSRGFCGPGSPSRRRGSQLTPSSCWQPLAKAVDWTLFETGMPRLTGCSRWRGRLTNARTPSKSFGMPFERRERSSQAQQKGAGGRAARPGRIAGFKLRQALWEQASGAYHHRHHLPDDPALRD